MNILPSTMSKFQKQESGQALAEYSLLFAFIVAVCIVAVTALGLAIATGIGGILPGF